MTLEKDLQKSITNFGTKLNDIIKSTKGNDVALGESSIQIAQAIKDIVQVCNQIASRMTDSLLSKMFSVEPSSYQFAHNNKFYHQKIYNYIRMITQ